MTVIGAVTTLVGPVLAAFGIFGGPDIDLLQLSLPFSAHLRGAVVPWGRCNDLGMVGIRQDWGEGEPSRSYVKGSFFVLLWAASLKSSPFITLAIVR